MFVGSSGQLSPEPGDLQTGSAADGWTANETSLEQLFHQKVLGVVVRLPEAYAVVAFGCAADHLEIASFMSSRSSKLTRSS